MKNKQFNFVLNIFIILVVLVLVLYFSLKDDYFTIMDAIFNMKLFYIILAIIMLLLYRICVSISHYLLIRQNRSNVSFWKCLQINFIILFFHGVTPFAGGGQPMEVYYLHEEGIHVARASNITLQNFIIYQTSLVLMGIFAICYNAFFHVFPKDNFIQKLVILGFSINFLILVFSYIVSFGEKFNRFILKNGIHFLFKVKLIRDEEKVRDKLNQYFEMFHENALALRNKRGQVLFYIFLNILGLLFLYSIPFVVAMGMHYSVNFFTSVCAVAYVMIVGSFVPIPGGTGGIEYSFMFFFGYFIHGSVLNAIMLVWRFITYYFGIVLGAVALSLYRKKEIK